MMAGKHGQIRVLVTGSRGWEDGHPIWAVLGQYLRYAKVQMRTFVLVYGDAKSGVDAIVHEWVKTYKHDPVLKPYRLRADWARYGKAAGMKRNTKMVNRFMKGPRSTPGSGFERRAWAFWDGESRGTKDCMTKVEDAGVVPYVVRRGGT